MAIERINVGTIANDGTGDHLRAAFVKVNNNFDILDDRVRPFPDFENLGAGTGIYYSTESNTIKLKSLVAGDNIVLSTDNDTITISSPASLLVNSDSGTITLSGGARSFGINGGQNIDTSANGNNITVALNANNLVERDLNPQLGGNLDAQTNDISNAGTITADSFVGNLTGLVNNLDLTVINNLIHNAVYGYDYGSVIPNVITLLDFLSAGLTVDYGTFIAPSDTASDYGSII